MSILFTEIKDEWGVTYMPTMAGYTVLVLIMLALVVMAGFVGGKKGRTFQTKQLVFSSAAIALGTVTSMIKLFHLPFGGSVTLMSMLFISLIGYWYGLRVGLAGAVAFGFLQLIIDPYIISIPQMLLDYIFAFGALGLSGLFSKKKHGLMKGYLLGAGIRLLFCFLSGVIFFASCADEWHLSVPVYSFLYNFIFIGAEACITIIIVLIPSVSKGLKRIKDMATA